MVHLPPLTETNPEVLMSMACSRESLAVLPAPGVATSGRTPAKVLRISVDEGAGSKNRPATSRIMAISDSNGTGDLDTSVKGVSVVPSKRCSAHGIANIMRPSGVCGSTTA